jgi:hypothetical protein
MLDPARYSILVRFVEIEGEPHYRATVKELPDLALYGKTAHEVYDLAVNAIRDLSAAAIEDGVVFPEPSEEINEYSGRITLRMPPSLHAKVASFGERDATSLNQYIVAVLAATVGAASRPTDVWSLAGTWHLDSKAKSVTDIQSSVTRSSPESVLLMADLLKNYSGSLEDSSVKVKYVIKRVNTPSQSNFTALPKATAETWARPVAVAAK